MHVCFVSKNSFNLETFMLKFQVLVQENIHVVILSFKNTVLLQY